MIARYPSAKSTYDYLIIGLVLEAVTALIRGISGDLVEFHL